jgi:competence protein ComEC
LQRIYHQASIKNNHWIKVNDGNSFSVRKLSSQIRDQFLDNYKKAGITGQEYAVLSALVLGYDDEIDATIMQAFSASGTLHVLSVSGMHVGLVFTALSFLLSFMEKKRKTRILRLFLLISALWFYAFLTGLSPSVIRSAMMFSFIVIGRSLDRTANIYNSLALSAILIFILIEPLMLFEVGLQLSFLAVAGIAFLYQKIYLWFDFTNYLFDKMWSLTAVSIAAQTSTFAVSVFYFHQFPNYFIPANLVIIPVSTIAIFTGIIILFFAPFPLLMTYAGWLIEKIVKLLNTSAVFFENLPGSVASGLSINITEMILINCILICMVVWLEKKNMKCLTGELILSILLFTSFIVNNIRNHQRKNLIVFSGTDSFSCLVVEGYQSLLLYHSADSSKAFRYRNSYCDIRSISVNQRKSLCIDNIVFSNGFITIDNNIISAGNISFLEVNSKKQFTILNNINFDYIYIPANLKIESEELKNASSEFLIAGNRSEEINLLHPEIKIHRLRQGAKVIDL